MEFKRHPERLWQHMLSMPFIYMMIVPLIVLDIFMEIYHRICFPLYGLKYVNRREYVKFDRHKLSYLTFTESLNCIYCSYANGFLGYASAIAGATEKYWCGIKHLEERGFKAPPHQKEFLEYGDEKAYEKMCKLHDEKKHEKRH